MLLGVTAVVLVFYTGAGGSSDTASEDSPGIFNLCVNTSTETTANQLEAPLDVTLTFSGKGGTNSVALSQTITHTIPHTCRGWRHH